MRAAERKELAIWLEMDHALIVSAAPGGDLDKDSWLYTLYRRNHTLTARERELVGIMARQRKEG